MDNTKRQAKRNPKISYNITPQNSQQERTNKLKQTNNNTTTTTINKKKGKYIDNQFSTPNSEGVTYTTTCLMAKKRVLFNKNSSSFLLLYFCTP